MSELKEHLFCECDECIREYRGPLSNEMRPYYLKSEADKYIQELEMDRDSYKVTYEDYRERVKTQGKLLSIELKNSRHHKYKRCLAMARWCEAEVHRALTEQSALIDFPEIDRFQYLQWRFVHFKRWHKRWLELAEKFKEVK